MELAITSRFKHAWNAFAGNRDPTSHYRIGPSYGIRPDRPRFTRGNERSIVTSLFNRMAIDASSVNIQHVQLDENGRFQHVIKSGLNECLTLSANIDQTGKAFFQDVVMSMLDEGNIAIVPVDTTRDPNDTESYDIESMRVGKILEWYPAHVKVRVYNERSGKKEDLIMSKRTVAIVENPFFAVINEPNSTMQRLIRKLALLDAIDEQSGSGKLDLIIQLPYVVKSEARKKQAEDRRADIERQLSGSKYGIAYTDGTERITQLNRPVENNLMKQIEFLTSMVYSQLGITQAVMDGTANEETMLNYYTRNTAVILGAIVDAMKRTFLSKTARSQNKTIMFYMDPFKLTPADKLAESANAYTRNGILTPNEFRHILGFKPSNDPKADQLVNSNVAQSNDTPESKVKTPEIIEEGEISQNGKHP